MVFTKTPENNEEIFLEVGEHLYPFNVCLPKKLPSSFEHTYGRIRYAINGTIDTPWYRFLFVFKHEFNRSFFLQSFINLLYIFFLFLRAYDKQTKMVITILNKVDLNYSPQLNEPVGANMIKVYGCCFCKTAPISVDFGVLKSK